MKTFLVTIIAFLFILSTTAQTTLEGVEKTINNSSGYFFTGAEIMTPGIKLQSVNNSGLNDIISGIHAGWGFRRTIGENITFDLNLRYAILMQNAKEVDFSNIIPGFKIGYRIK